VSRNVDRDNSLPSQPDKNGQVRGRFSATKGKIYQANNCYLQLLALTLVVLAVYLPVCRYGFLNFDDPTNVSANPHLIGGGLEDFFSFWQHPYANLYIPVSYSFWFLVAKITAGFAVGQATVLAPAAFHSLNLLTHLANVLLAFLILRRLLADARAAWIGAVLFAVHPLQVEAVAWVSEFRGLLSGFWALLSIHQYLLHADGIRAGRTGQPYYALATLFFGLALLAKPSAVVLPLLLGLIGHLLLQRPPRQLARELLPWLLLTVAIVVVTRFAQQATTLNFYPDLGQRLLIAGDGLSFSLSKLLLPITFGPDYGRTPEYVLAHGWIWLTGFLPGLFLLVLWGKSSRGVLFMGAFWGVALLPVLGLVSFDFQKVSTMTDRYCYLAMLGPAFGMGMLWAHFPGSHFWKWLLLGVLVLLGVKSSLQVRSWENDYTFNRQALQVNPQSWLANNNLGYAYFTDGQPQTAIPYYEQAVRLNPGNLAGHTNLADAQAALGLNREALASYQNALALSPRNPWLFLSLGETYQKLGEPGPAIAAFQQALVSKPDMVEPYQRLGEVFTGMGRFAEAEVALQKAIATAPGFAPAYLAQARLYRQMGRLNLAESSYDQAEALGLNDPDFRQELAGKRLLVK